MRAVPLFAALALTLAALARCVPDATAQPTLCPASYPTGQPPPASLTLIPCPTPTPTPTPPPPVVVDIPGEAVIPPNGTVIFRRADGATLGVSGLGGARAAYDGTTLTVTVPAIGPNQGLSGGGEGAVCSPAPLGQRVLSCSARPTPEGARVSLGTVIADPPPTPTPGPRICATLLSFRGGFDLHRCYPLPPPPGSESVPLRAGCTNVVSTYPDGTALEEIYANLVQPDASGVANLRAFWKQDAASGRFVGAALVADGSRVPPEANELTALDRLDAFFICLNEPGIWYRPRI